MRGRSREDKMSKENQRLLRQLCEESCVELFKAYDVALDDAN